MSGEWLHPICNIYRHKVVQEFGGTSHTQMSIMFTVSCIKCSFFSIYRDINADVNILQGTLFLEDTAQDLALSRAYK